MVKNILLKVETVQFMGVVGVCVCVRRIVFNQQTVLISTSDQHNIDTNTYNDEVQNRRFYFHWYSQKDLIGVCGLLPKTLTLLVTKTSDFFQFLIYMT